MDVVGYSMGGLIVRSYLSGKQEAQGQFTPPPNILIGKVIFIATPHFGSPVAALAFGGSTQADELSSGSHFLMDLNTWNQNRDDLRGIDAIAIAGTGGTGLATTPDSMTDWCHSAALLSVFTCRPERVSCRCAMWPRRVADRDGLLSAEREGNRQTDQRD